MSRAEIFCAFGSILKTGGKEMKTKKMKASDCSNTKNASKKSGSSKCSSNQKNID